MRRDLVRAAVLEVVGAVRAEGQFADRALDRVLRRERRLYSGERRAVAHQLFALLRQERALDFALFGREPPGVPATLVRVLRLAALEVREGADAAEAAREHGLAEGWVPRLARATSPLPADLAPVERIALEGSLPDFVARLLADELGDDEALALARAFGERAPLTVRANLLETDRDSLARRLASEGVHSRPTRWSPLGLVLEARVNAFGLAAFRDGCFEVQDEGSQLIAHLVGARPGERVVDACAGAGGKTLALAAAMGNRGELWALDVDGARLEELGPRARRAGAHNVRSLAIPAEAPSPDVLGSLVARADRVLVDAPCTGLGALRRNPDARARFHEGDFERFAATQARLLSRFAGLVRPGGRLVYATCSVAREEDEAVVERFLSNGPGFAPVPVADLEPSFRELTRGPCLRTFPHRHGMDGFFAAVLERRP